MHHLLSEHRLLFFEGFVPENGAKKEAAEKSAQQPVAPAEESAGRLAKAREAQARAERLRKQSQQGRPADGSIANLRVGDRYVDWRFGGALAPEVPPRPLVARMTQHLLGIGPTLAPAAAQQIRELANIPLCSEEQPDPSSSHASLQYIHMHRLVDHAAKMQYAELMKMTLYQGDGALAMNTVNSLFAGVAHFVLEVGGQRGDEGPRLRRLIPPEPLDQNRYQQFLQNLSPSARAHLSSMNLSEHEKGAIVLSMGSLNANDSDAATTINYVMERITREMMTAMPTVAPLLANQHRMRLFYNILFRFTSIDRSTFDRALEQHPFLNRFRELSDSQRELIFLFVKGMDAAVGIHPSPSMVTSQPPATAPAFMDPSLTPPRVEQPDDSRQPERTQGLERGYNILSQYDPAGRTGNVLRRYNQEILRQLQMAGCLPDPAALGNPPRRGGNPNVLRMADARSRRGILHHVVGLLRMLGLRL